MHAQERERITPWIALKMYRGLQGTHQKKKTYGKTVTSTYCQFSQILLRNPFRLFYLCPTPYLIPLCCPSKLLSTWDYLVQYKQQIKIFKKKKISALCSFLQSLPQSCKLISSTRTRLQAPWEYVYGIMLHCQCL